MIEKMAYLSPLPDDLILWAIDVVFCYRNIPYENSL